MLYIACGAHDHGRMRPPPPSPLQALRLALVCLAVAACEHSAPGDVRGPQDVGPFSPDLPRRLTFHAGDDWTPSVSGSTLVYARQGSSYPSNYGTWGREQCIAFLPVEGGTIRSELCPHRLLPTADTLVHTWIEPVLSPDGRRIAFVWQRGPNVGELAFNDVFLVVVPVERPADTTQVRHRVIWTRPAVPNPIRADMATRITWADSSRLRFLATDEHIFKLKAGGEGRVTDTIFEPLALMELDLATGTSRLVPGGDSALAYAPAPDGGIWLVRASDPAALLRLDPATGVATPAGRFSSAVVDLIAVEGGVVAIVDPIREPASDESRTLVYIVRGGAGLERLDPGTGELLPITNPLGPVRRLAAVPGRRLFVVEVEPELRSFGVPPDLWLFGLP